MGKFRFEINKLNLLIGINAVIFALAIILQLVFAQGFDRSLFLLFGGFSYTEVSQGNFWLLLTTNFFHIDILHFLFNIYSLQKVGQIVKMYYGDTKLYITYIVGGVISSIFTYLAITFLNLNIEYSLGASGAVFALFGLLIGGTLKRNRFGASLPFELKDFYLPIILTFSLALIPGLRVNHWAHIGGAITGIIFGLILNNSMGGTEANSLKLLIKFLFIFSTLFLVLSYLALMLNFADEIIF